MRGALFVTTALVGRTLALPAQAQQTWVAETSTDWFDAANGDTGVPTAADDANIAESSAANMPVIDGAAAVADGVNATAIIVGEAGAGGLIISESGGVVNALSIVGNTVGGSGGHGDRPGFDLDEYGQPFGRRFRHRRTDDL